MQATKYWTNSVDNDEVFGPTEFETKEEAFHIMYKVMKKIKYIKRRAWQRSSRNHPVKSHCRHARNYKRVGYRYKGGK